MCLILVGTGDFMELFMVEASVLSFNSISFFMFSDSISDIDSASEANGLDFLRPVSRFVLTSDFFRLIPKPRVPAEVIVSLLIGLPKVLSFLSLRKASFR